MVDHEDPAAVAELVATIAREHGRLDVLVNDIFGGDRYMEWDKPLWEHSWEGGLRMLQMGVHTHLITSYAAIPLMLRTADDHGAQGLVVEMTDGTSEANASFRRNVGFYYDLVKANVERIVIGLSAELEDQPDHRGRRHAGLAPLGAHARELRRHRGELARRRRDERPASGSPSRPPTSREASRHWPGPTTPIAGPGRSRACGSSADAYGFTDTDGSKPDCWGHLVAKYGWDHSDGRGIDEFR